jgi:lipopolysaccharide heptosyltransferase II
MLTDHGIPARDPPFTRSAWEAAKRILCVRLDALGDVLMTTPAIRALKESQPLRSVTLLTSAAAAAAARLVPEIDEILIYEAPWMKASSALSSSAPDLEMIKTLRAARFDAAIIFTVYSQNPLPAALLCYLADIPLRIAHCRENPYRLLTDWVCEIEPDTGWRHEVQRQLDLVAVIGASTENQRLSLNIPAQARATVDALLAQLLEDGQPWLVIHPGATAASRRYPPEGFAAVARRAVQDLRYAVVFTGQAPELELTESIRISAGVRSHSLVGQLDFAGFAALLARTRLLISNNTGAVHVAAALGTPVVDLYALTNPQHTPWRVPHRVLFQDVPCKYCYKSICPQGHHNCLRLLRPEAVIQATQALLDETGTSTSVERTYSVYAWH